MSDLVLRISGDSSGGQAALRELSESLRSVGVEVDSMRGALRTFGELVGVSFSVGAAVEFGKQLLEDANALQAMADRTGVGVEALQRLRVAGEESGNSLEQLVTSINKMQRNLATDNTSAVAAVAQLNLNFDDLKKLEPEQQFAEIGEAIKKIPDPAEQVAVAMALFGRAGAQVLPTLKADLKDIAEHTVVMSTAAVAAFDHLHDRLGRLYAFLKAGAGDYLARFLTPFGPGGPIPVTTASTLHRASGDLDAWLRLHGAEQNAPKPVLAGSIGMIALPSADTLARIKAQSDALFTAADATIKHAEAVAKALDVISGAKAQEELRTLTDAWNKLTPAQKANDQVVARMLDDYERIRAQVRPDALPADFENLRATHGKLHDEVVTLEGSTKNLATQWSALDAAFKEMPGRINVDVLPSFSSTLDRLNHIEHGVLGIGSAIEHVGFHTKPSMADLHGGFTLWGQDLTAIEHALNEVASTSSGVFAGILRDIARAISALQQAHNEVVAFNRAQKDHDTAGEVAAGVAMVGTFASATAPNPNAGTGQGQVTGALSGAAAGAEIGSIAGPWGMAAGAAIGAIVGALRNLGPSAAEKTARELVAQFEQQMGGVDAMRKKIVDAYEATGRSADAANADITAMWAAEAQGGAAVQQVIDRINSAFQQQQNIATGVQSILDAAHNVGGAVPQELQPVIDSLLHMQGLTDGERTALETLRSGGQTDFQGLTQEASTFGITLADLGSAFQHHDIVDKSQAIFQEFTKLTDAGAGANGVIHGMRTRISEVVQESLKFGTTVPEQMKPFIQRLIDTGDLVDIDGHKITDMTGIKFDDTKLDSGMGALTTALNNLRDTLLHLPANAQEAARGIGEGLSQVKVPTIDLHYRYTADDSPVPMAAGGYGRVYKPTLFLAGEAGAEDYAFSGAGGSFAGVGGDVHVHVDASGSIFQGDRSQMRELAMVISDHITDRFTLTGNYIPSQWAR